MLSYNHGLVIIHPSGIISVSEYEKGINTSREKLQVIYINLDLLEGMNQASQNLKLFLFFWFMSFWVI